MTCGKRESSARCVRDPANGGDRWCAEAESDRHGPRLRQLFLTWFRRRRRLTLLPGRKPGRSTGRDSGAEGRPDARETWTKELEGGPKGSIFYLGLPCSGRASARRWRPNADAIVEEAPAESLCRHGAGREPKHEHADRRRKDGHTEHAIYRKPGARNDRSRPPLGVHSVREGRIDESDERSSRPRKGLRVR